MMELRVWRLDLLKVEKVVAYLDGHVSHACLPEL